MGLYDTYEPQPAIGCPICAAPSRGWQGKDGPCVFLLWRQGTRHPVDQPIDADARMDPTRYREFTLPPSFTIGGSCVNGHFYVATGSAPDGVWSETELT